MFLKKFLLSLFGLCLITLLSCSDSRELTVAERYPGPWVDAFNLKITKALVSNHVRLCGDYKYRKSSQDNGEYLVYCTVDDDNWYAYTVWANTGAVVGPSKADMSLL